MLERRLYVYHWSPAVHNFCLVFRLFFLLSLVLWGVRSMAIIQRIMFSHTVRSPHLLISYTVACGTRGRLWMIYFIQVRLIPVSLLSYWSVISLRHWSCHQELIFPKPNVSGGLLIAESQTLLSWTWLGPVWLRDEKRHFAVDLDGRCNG